MIIGSFDCEGFSNIPNWDGLFLILKERERLGDRLITQIERRLLLSLDFGLWRFLLPSIHSSIHTQPTPGRRRGSAAWMTIVDVHQRLFPSGVSFVCLIDWESEKERESEKEVSGCWIKFLLARSLVHTWRFFFTATTTTTTTTTTTGDGCVDWRLAGWL